MEVVSRLKELRRRFMSGRWLRPDPPEIEIVDSPTKDDRAWAEELIEKRGWDELREKK